MGSNDSNPACEDHLAGAVCKKFALKFIYQEITTVVLVEFDSICELQPEFRP